MPSCVHCNECEHCCHHYGPGLIRNVLFPSDDSICSYFLMHSILDIVLHFSKIWWRQLINDKLLSTSLWCTYDWRQCTAVWRQCSVRWRGETLVWVCTGQVCVQCTVTQYHCDTDQVNMTQDTGHHHSDHCHSDWQYDKMIYPSQQEQWKEETERDSPMTARTHTQQSLVTTDNWQWKWALTDSDQFNWWLI